jgi:hypothetical protein
MSHVRPASRKLDCGAGAKAVRLVGKQRSELAKDVDMYGRLRIKGTTAIIVSRGAGAAPTFF